MKPLLILFLCLAASMAFADDRPPAKHRSHEFGEKGERSLGYYIVAEEGVDHNPNTGDTPTVFYYVADKDSRKRSQPVATAVIGREYLSFLWTDHQKCLVVAQNLKKDFWVGAYGLDSKGTFKELKTGVDDEDMMKKIFAATYWIKDNPEWSGLKGGPKQPLPAHQHVDAEHVSEDDISIGATFVDIPICIENVRPWITIRYRFEAETRKFIRLDVILKEKYDEPGFKVSNSQLEKVLPKIVLQED